MSISIFECTCVGVGLYVVCRQTPECVLRCVCIHIHLCMHVLCAVCTGGGYQGKHAPYGHM